MDIISCYADLEIILAYCQKFKALTALILVGGIYFIAPNRVTVLLKDSHELKYSESPSNLQGLEPAVKAAQYLGTVVVDIDYPEPLQVQVLIKGLITDNRYFLWRNKEIWI